MLLSNRDMHALHLQLDFSCVRSVCHCVETRHVKRSAFPLSMQLYALHDSNCDATAGLFSCASATGTTT